MAASPQYRLGTLSIVALIVAAIVADAITLIPFAGDFIGPAYWVIVSIFLYTNGFGILNARRLSTSVISMVAELIPAVQELPLILAGTIAVIIFSRIEDKLGIKVPTLGGQATGNTVKGVAPGQMPLNVDGVRRPAQ